MEKSYFHGVKNYFRDGKMYFFNEEIYILDVKIVFYYRISYLCAQDSKSFKYGRLNFYL